MTFRALAVSAIAAAACGGTPAPELEGDPAGADLASGKAAEILVYSEDGWTELADALARDPAPGATYFLHIPAPSTDKTWPRGPLEPARMRARSPQFRALAEFHWGAWSGVSGSWYQKGVEFRRRMAERGYDVAQGDSWAINELPSSVRRDAAARQNVRDAVRGLGDGPAGAPRAKGAVFVIGLGSNTTNLAVYKPQLESWLADAGFWEAMAPQVRFWGQETYTDPATACVPGVIVAERSRAISAFVEHVGRLADAGGARTAAARSFLSRTYTPLLNGAFRSPAYQTDGVPLQQMKEFVSTQIYAARAAGAQHAYAAGRVGLGWAFRRQQVTEPELVELAQRIASALHYAYDPAAGAAAGACSPSHAYTFCQCALHGAAFNPAWSTFTSW